ncbi:hypothetical protein L0F63_006178 [Massospora cicadina]|nr:hypothetical protein L0F63_006178 [Massospora cicadina]
MAQTTEAAEYLAKKTGYHSDSDLAAKQGLALQTGTRSLRAAIHPQTSQRRSSTYQDGGVAEDMPLHDSPPQTHTLAAQSFSGLARKSHDQLSWGNSSRTSLQNSNTLHQRGLKCISRSFDNLHSLERGGHERRLKTAAPPTELEGLYLEAPQSAQEERLPQPQIPTKEALENYRQNAKKSHDPEVQLDFAKYLIETAAIVLANYEEQVDPQTARNLHNTLIAEALKWIKRLSSQGIGLGKGAYPDAQFFLANCYNNGSLGLQVDHDKAFNLYVQASKQNHPAATYRTGVCYEFGAGTKRDHHRALQFFRKAAALGDTAAMFKVGMVLLKGGLGQQPNPREGITWLKRAAASADEENPHALHELALCYEKGGIPSIIADASYARELYTQAAQLGYAHSQFKMGVCYEQGLLTCPVDPRRSIAWFTRGAEQGDPECELALSGWYLTGSEGVLKQSDTEAYLWARKAADKGLAKAEYAVGYYSEVGIGAKPDLDEARRWFMRAAAQGNKRAMERVNDLKKFGAGRKAGAKPKEDGGCSIS